VKTATENLPEVAAVEPLSAGARMGLLPGDRIVSVNGVEPRDILEWQRLVDNSEIDLHIVRGRETLDLEIVRAVGEPFGVSINSAVFDRIHTCDNHCEFCFIYQLPKGMRRSLYLKDDDYRLSFLFGNFTTLTRFTEADLERVIDERLSPLYVSIHATDPHVRSEMLRNTRGGFSLRWMKVLLENDINIRAQIVLCPGVNDGEILDATLGSLLEECPQLESIAIVPLGLSRFNTETRMRVHTKEEAVQVIATVSEWQHRYAHLLGRHTIHLADEFYLVAGVEVPPAAHYGEYPMLEDGVGLVRSFIDAFAGTGPDLSGRHDGFFSSVDSSSPTDYVRIANPAVETSLRSVATPVAIRGARHRSHDSIAVVTGSYGAVFIRSLLENHGYSNIQVLEVVNSHFGGNTAVAGLMTGGDLRAAMAQSPANTLFLLPNVCLNNGVFLDGVTLEELATEFDVEVIATSGAALRKRLTAETERSAHV
jgi:putative radical SAM enzyme (TIGR03279 family)